MTASWADISLAAGVLTEADARAHRVVSRDDPALAETSAGAGFAASLQQLSNHRGAKRRTAQLDATV
jgi:hypothetical protein